MSVVGPKFVLVPIKVYLPYLSFQLKIPEMNSFENWKYIKSQRVCYDQILLSQTLLKFYAQIFIYSNFSLLPAHHNISDLCLYLTITTTRSARYLHAVTIANATIASTWSDLLNLRANPIQSRYTLDIPSSSSSSQVDVHHALKVALLGAAELRKLPAVQFQGEPSKSLRICQGHRCWWAR